MTIVLHWWFVPLGMAIGTLLLWWWGSTEDGMFGGIVQFLLGCGLLVGAAGACLVRLFV